MVVSEQVDKKSLVNRLKRIEGQVRGLQQMIEQERSCQEVMTQVSAVVSALHRVSELVARRYAHRCIAEVAESGKTDAIDTLIENIMKLGGSK